MMLDEMCRRLLNAARSMGWESRIEPTLTARAFRGRTEQAEVRLPELAYGLMLGRYPVLTAYIHLAREDVLMEELRAVHNQMIIARSFMRTHQIIDAHILFVATEPQPQADWRKQIDMIERNESVCRKL